MALTSLCFILSTLSVTPHRSQFFQYDRITLTCVANSSGWTVKRTVSSSADQECQHGWAIPSNSSCIIGDAYPEDSGEYWCESQRGECSNKVNITITDNVFIGRKIPGELTLKAEEGFYKCQHPSKGESQQSWLAVKAKNQPTDFPPTSPPVIFWPRLICGTVLFIFYSFILILCIHTYRKWARV
ncbi:uncharacterized protein LOC111611212 isoform X2 [Xiphophorus maculatus]|uniref:uncharacterized protein LOC111611212 isoform X2 n=1 Tax=Xiphophorus maculatus TaxID=8083 RepID=UPI000C6CB25E|nr:uncharacterized protein LOC111611212 isoform X2 [Xiphophorus maculatus]